MHTQAKKWEGGAVKMQTAVVQPGQTLGPGKDKSDKLGQDEEWVRIPELCFTKDILIPQASEEGGSLPPSSVKPIVK